MIGQRDGWRFGLPLKGLQTVALATAVLLAGWLATPAEAAKREDHLAGLTSSQRRVFQNYTRMYCQLFFRFEDRFVILPNYQRARENSTGRTENEMEEKLTVTKRVLVQTSLGKQYKNVDYPPPKAEVIVASRVIPSIDVGHYGFINSVVIKEIIGPEEMIITKLEMIPANQIGNANNDIRKAAAERQKEYQYKNYRLLGFNTKDLKAGDKYYGPRKKGLQVAVMSTDPKYEFVMVDYDKLQRVRTSEFAEALDYVQVEPLAFIDMVRENRETLQAEGDKASLIYIYRRFYNRYRPKRLSYTTRPEIRVQRPDPEPQPEPDPDREPSPGITFPDRDPEPEPEPDPEPRPQPEPEEEEQEDDWDSEEDTQKDSDTPTFFGIPL